MIMIFTNSFFTSSDNMKLQIQATNKSCTNGQWLYLQVHNKNFTELFSHLFLPMFKCR